MTKPRTKHPSTEPQENTREPQDDPNIKSQESATLDDTSFEDVRLAIAKGKLDIRRFGFILLLVSIALFTIGYALTTLSAAMVNYHQLALEERTVTQNGEVRQVPRYRSISRYKINNNNNDEVETKFSRAGSLLTGLYFYALVNALHWLLEFGIANIRAIVLIPFFLFLAGSAFVYYSLWPKELQTPNNAFTLSIIIGAIHGIFTFLLILFAHVFFNSFSALLGSPHHFVGQLSGILLPGLVIVFFTDMIYAGFAGIVLGVFHKLRLIFSQT